jgi:hypothetical protein
MDDRIDAFRRRQHCRAVHRIADPPVDPLALAR